MNLEPVGEETAADLREALAAAPLAAAAWELLTPIGRRDFMRWIDSAKQEDTRRRRIERACENLAAGKRRPCCFAVVPMDLYKALKSDPIAKAQWSGLTPDERRDFSDWVESASGRETRLRRVEEACAMLAVGKRGPC